MKSRRSLSTLVVLPILVATVITVIGGLSASSVLSDRRLRNAAENRAVEQLTALETVVNVSDLAGLRRAATTTGASRDVQLILVAAGNPAVIIAASHTELVGRSVQDLDGDLRQAVAARAASGTESTHTYFGNELLTATSTLQVRATARDGTDLSNAFGIVQIDFSAIAGAAAGDSFMLTVGGVVAVLLIAGVAIWLLRRHVLRPLQDIRDCLNDPDHAAVAGATSLEIERLARNLQSALSAHEQAEGQLAEANQQLRELVDSKDRFMASISHELRTPLASIIGFAGYVKDPDLELSDADRAAFVDTISREGEDVMDLIEDLLTSAQADIGRLAVTRVNVGLLAQAHQVVEGLMGRTDGIEVRGKPVTVSGDPRRVRQIVRNLLTNAARYGGSQVHVEIVSCSDMGCLRVVDDGPGIDDADRELIFEAFERARDGVRNAESVGVGLPVARTLARLMGGDLEYRREGGMTVFELALPLAEKEAPTVAAHASGDAAAAIGSNG
jgi:signal transduction histidine kinase